MRIVVAMAFLGPAIITFNVVFGRMIDVEVRWSSWPGDVAIKVLPEAVAQDAERKDKGEGGER